MKRQISHAAILLLILFSSSSGIFLDDFLVNTENRAEWQEWCFIAADENGNFYITYTTDFYNGGAYDSAFGYIKKYAPDGTKLLGPFQITPKGMFVEYGGMLAVSPSGRVAVTWDMTPKVFSAPVHPYVQVFDSNLNITTSVFRIDTIFDSLAGPYLSSHDLDMDDRGHFTLIIHQPKAAPDTNFYQRFDSVGNPLGTLILAETPDCAPCQGTQNPHLGVSRNGRIALALEGNIWPDPYTYPIARVFDSTGSPLLNRVMVTCDGDTSYPTCGQATDTCFNGYNGDLAIQDNGNFLYVFSGCDGNPITNFVYGRVFDSLGRPIAPIFKISTGNPMTVWLYPKVIADGHGGYVVAWTDARNQAYQNGRRDVFLQRVDSLGNPIGMNFRVNDVKSSKGYDEVAFDVACDGQRVYVVWGDRRDFADWSWDIYAQVMDLDLVGTYMLGDANFDQQISLADVIFTVNYIFKGKPLPEGDVLVADVNGDCRVSLVDVIYEVNYIFGKGPPFVPGCLP